ncbi:uncharacterized protein B0I36DRAFT_88347 [Microdochium trichocladiopsis]|uniref:Uncharacterized protein n=1 Tax=Microdochium trichocladiopsis TaxID=1682393 RepID=A0A9P9BQP8_9PEZI|nr:uncharacterized protein B0I36DRAFT_88347 [Microdochium trichocladiopsis]KAH7035113.1 hypothetical protein B0I36DRAFT_88347 [Microdochium trichocladiopsis]
MDHVRIMRKIADETCLPLGHAALGTCPLDLRSNARLPPNYEPGPMLDDGTVHTGELSRADLATLLDLSSKLNLDGEITPIMAWGALMNHPRIREMGYADFLRVTEELQGKVRCYGSVVESLRQCIRLCCMLTVTPSDSALFLRTLSFAMHSRLSLVRNRALRCSFVDQFSFLG